MSFFNAKAQRRKGAKEDFEFSFAPLRLCAFALKNPPA